MLTPRLLRLGRFMDIRDFIPKTSLQRMLMVELVMDLNYDSEQPQKGEAWLVMAESLLDVWCQNRCLKSLVIRHDYSRPEAPMRDPEEAAHHKKVNQLLAMVRTPYIHRLNLADYVTIAQTYWQTVEVQDKDSP
jgi:hypothetical protein